MLRGLDGEAAAHAELLSDLGGYLRAFFGRRLGTGAGDVEDLVQETLIAIHLKRDTYDPGQPFSPWAYAIARYKLIDHQRAQRRRPTVPIEAVEDLFAEQNPEEGAVRRDLDKLLSGLPDRQRRLVEGVRLQGLSMEEAAQGAGMSPVAVRVSLHRALKTLMRRVRDEDR